MGIEDKVCVGCLDSYCDMMIHGHLACDKQTRRGNMKTVVIYEMIVRDVSKQSTGPITMAN